MPADSQNMLGVIKQFPQQCKEALGLPKGISVPGTINSIVVAGMGGSAISGDLLKIYLRDMPVTVTRGYRVPKFVNEDTLVFVVSYSGNTEETYHAYLDAYEKRAKIIAITSGGKLQDDCEKVIKIPSGLQPRAALGYLFFPMLGILHNSNLVRVRNDELNEMLDLLKEVGDFNEEGEAISKKLRDKIPIIYASQDMYPLAIRWKTQINENAKLPAFYNVFSEMNHNEICGFKGMGAKYKVIMLRDKKDHKQIQKRMDICKEIMEETVEVEEIHTQGSSLLARIFTTIYLGDFVSYHLAVWNRTDPTPVEVIDTLKRKLQQ